MIGMSKGQKREVYMLSNRLWLSCILLFGIVVIASDKVVSGDEPSEKVTLDQLSREVDELSRKVEHLSRKVDELSHKVDQPSEKVTSGRSSEKVKIRGVEIQFLATGKTYAPWNGQVKLFEGFAGVRHEEIGRMFVKVNAGLDPLDVVEAIREEAKKKGANGVILDSSLGAMQQSLSIGALAGMGVDMTVKVIRVFE